MISNDEAAIKNVIEAAYIDGIHGDQNVDRIQGGFHHDFAMLVLTKNEIDKVTVDEWLKRIASMKQADSELWTAKTSHAFRLIDVTGNAATAKLDVYKGTRHFSTDYMLLYKFDEGWRIVSKIFTSP